MKKILIGTSGYDHPELVGSFYPVGLKRKEFLEYYFTQFSALELNSTFYGMPTAERIKSFYDRSQGRLKFSIKLTQTLTHKIAKGLESSGKNVHRRNGSTFGKKCACNHSGPVSGKL